MTDDLVKRLRSNRPIPTLPHEAADRIEALTAENERLRNVADAKIDALTTEVEELREHLSGALETLRDAGVCDDKCSLCNEAFAALDTGITIEAPQEGGWKEAGHPWLWTYDPHLKGKKP